MILVISALLIITFLLCFDSCSNTEQDKGTRETQITATKAACFYFVIVLLHGRHRANYEDVCKCSKEKNIK